MRLSSFSGMDFVSPPNNGREQTSLLIIAEVDAWPFFNCAFDARAESSVGQQTLGYVGNKNRVADIGVTGPALVHRKMIGQMARTYNFDAIIKDEETDGRTYRYVTSRFVDCEPSWNQFGERVTVEFSIV